MVSIPWLVLGLVRHGPIFDERKYIKLIMARFKLSSLLFAGVVPMPAKGRGGLKTRWTTGGSSSNNNNSYNNISSNNISSNNISRQMTTINSTNVKNSSSSNTNKNPLTARTSLVKEANKAGSWAKLPCELLCSFMNELFIRACGRFTPEWGSVSCKWCSWSRMIACCVFLQSY